MEENIYNSIKAALASAPRNDYGAELYLQMLKHSDSLQSISAREFCESLNVPKSYGGIFNTLRKITAELKEAGLDVDKL